MTIVNQQPMIVPADVDGDGTIGFSDVLVILNDWGACPQAQSLLSSKPSAPPFLAYDVRMKIVSFRAGCGGHAAGMDAIGDMAWGNRHCFHSWRPFRPVDGVGRRPLSWLFDLLSHLCLRITPFVGGLTFLRFRILQRFQEQVRRTVVAAEALPARLHQQQEQRSMSWNLAIEASTAWAKRISSFEEVSEDWLALRKRLAAPSRFLAASA